MKKFFYMFCLLTGVVISNSYAQTYNINTFAGSGNYSYCCDGAPATDAQLYLPYGVTVDNSGNVYIADTKNNRIREVDTSGIISTFAGNGTKGYSGNGGAATSAELNFPTGVAVDDSGNLLIADDSNNVIRKVNTHGIISTIAGNNIRGYSGDNGVATSAMLNTPMGVAVDDSNNVYIADYANERIRKVKTNSIILTLAGNGTEGYSGDNIAATSAELSQPTGVGCDISGNIYIADRGNARIRKVNSGIISTVAGTGIQSYGGDGGPATLAALGDPSGVTADDSGNVYIADLGNNLIRMINKSGIITSVAGRRLQGYCCDGGQAVLAYLNNPFGVAIDASGNMYIADLKNSRIRKVDTSGIISTLAGTGNLYFGGDGGLAVSAELNGPQGVSVDTSGNVYVADFNNNRIRKINKKEIITTFAGNSAVGDGNGGFSGNGGQATAAGLNLPSAVAIDKSGNVFIADFNNEVIRTVDINGIISTFAGNRSSGFTVGNPPATDGELYYPMGVAVDDSENVYISNGYTNIINKVDPGDTISTYAGIVSINGLGSYSGDGGPATAAELYSPYGLAVDDSGNLFIADQYNSVIRKVNKGDTISTVAGSINSGYSGDGSPATAAKLNGPGAVAVDDSGNIYIADTWNNVIRKVNKKGIISTIAGNDTAGFSGDGGAATSAKLNAPYGVAVDASGNVYVGDYGNNRIRILTIDTNTATNVKQLTVNTNLVTLYPNPNNGNFVIQLQKIEQNTQIEIFNVLSENVYRGKLDSRSIQLNLSKYNSGIYLYRVLDEQNNLLGEGKFIIE